MSQHLQAVFGLSQSADANLCACVNELFDNALDSGASRVDVHITDAACANQPSRWTVRVSDDGRGFGSELGHVADLFSTTKGTGSTNTANGVSTGVALEDINGASTTGTFGVGLKSVIQWAHLTDPGASVEIRTTTLDDDCMNILHVRLRDADGSACSLYPLLEHARIPKGTKSRFSGSIVIATLGGTQNVFPLLARRFERVRAFLADAPLVVTVRLPSAAPIKIQASAAPLDALYTSSTRSETSNTPPVLPGVREHLMRLAADTWRAATTSTSAGRTIQGQQQEQSWVSGFGEGVAVLSASSIVHATLLLAAAAPESDDPEYGDGSDAPTGTLESSTTSLSLPAATLVFLNNKAIGEHMDPVAHARSDAPCGLSARCASVAGLLKVQWKLGGMTLDPASLQLRCDSGAVRGLWLALHLRSSACCPLCQFGDLAKSFVAPSKELVRGISTAVNGALALAQQALASQGVPLAKRDRQARENRRLADIIGRSIASVVCHSRDEEVLDECIMALRLDGEHREDIGEDRVASVLIEHLLRDWSQLVVSTSLPQTAAG